MKSNTLIVLAITSIILSAYIFYIYFFVGWAQENYHVGCYLSDHNFNHFTQFKSKLRQLQHRKKERSNLDSKLRPSELFDPELKKKSLELTNNVQDYIQKLVLVKKYQEGNFHFLTELESARRGYHSCAMNIIQDVNSEDCTSLWGSYSTCFSRFKSQQDSLSRLYLKREIYQNDILKLISYQPKKNDSVDIKEQLRRIEAEHEKIIKLNEQNVTRVKKIITQSQQSLNLKKIQYDQTILDISIVDEEIRQCDNNLQSFKKCETLDQVLREYGTSESVQSLETRIKSKGKTLMKIQSLLAQNRGDIQKLNLMYQKGQKQFQQIIKLRISIGQRAEIECGCNQQTRKDFKNRRVSLQQKQLEVKVQIKNFKSKIQRYETEIQDLQNRKKDLIIQFKEEMEKLKRKYPSVLIGQDSKLKELLYNLNQVNNQIFTYKRTLHSLEFECNQYKNRLHDRINTIEDITKCLSKKDLYQKLKQRADFVLKKDDLTSSQYKQRIIQTLNTIYYPANFAPIHEGAKMIQSKEELESEIKQLQQSWREDRQEKKTVKEVLKNVAKDVGNKVTQEIKEVTQAIKEVTTQIKAQIKEEFQQIKQKFEQKKQKFEQKKQEFKQDIEEFKQNIQEYIIGNKIQSKEEQITEVTQNISEVHIQSTQEYITLENNIQTREVKTQYINEVNIETQYDDIAATQQMKRMMAQLELDIGAQNLNSVDGLDLQSYDL